MSKYILPFLFTVMSTLFFCGQTNAQNSAGFLKGQVYLKVSDTSSVVLDPYNNNIPALNQIISKYSVDSIKSAFKTPDTILDKIYKAHFSDSSKADSLVLDLGNLNFIEYAEKVPLHYTNYTPDDLWQNQWNLNIVEAAKAWDISRGGAGVKVAVVDNAVYLSHEDLAPTIWNNPGEQDGNGFDDDLNGYTDDKHGYDVANDDSDPNPPAGVSASDPFSHGTHCAGIVSAATDNGKGLASLGFDLDIMAVKCSPDSNGQTLPYAYDGIDYAISAGADVISMSFGTPTNSATGQYVISSAATRGIVLVAAAGNSDTTRQLYPAAYSDVIAVGATNPNDEKAWFSNYGSWVDVMAPGTGIQSTVTGSSSSYGSKNGTSMACPHVAALAGLILSEQGNASPSQVKNIISSGCENIDSQNASYQGQLGSGRINAYQSLLLTGSQVGQTVESKFQIYPNPVHSVLYLNVNSQYIDAGNYELLDFLGRKVQTGNVANQSGKVRIELNKKLPPGVYFLKMGLRGKDQGDTIIVTKKLLHR